jgi:hypothetical protein
MREIIGVLFAIIAGAIAMLAITPKVNAWWISYKNQSLTDSALFAYQQMQPRFAARGGFGTASISAATIAQYNALPSRMIQVSGGTTTLSNDFSGTWTFAGSGQRLIADTDGVPAANCKALVVDLAADGGFHSFAVASTIAGLGAATAQTPPLTDDATAATLCAGSTNAIRFVVGP